MNISAHVKLGVCGRFRGVAHKVDAAGNIISSREAFPWTDNIVTDQGLNFLGGIQSNTLWQGIVVGTGNNPPLATDTTLQTGLAFTSSIAPGGGESTVMQVAATPYYCQKTVTYRFNTGTAAGVLSELGMAGRQGGSPTPAARTVYSRALIVDGGGNPTTITILSDEIFDVTYQHRTYITSTASGTFQQTIDGTLTNFDYTIIPALMTANASAWGDFTATSAGFQAFRDSTGNYNINGGAATGALGAITSVPAGTNAGWSSVSTATYTSGNYYIDGTFTMNTSSANFTMASLCFAFTHAAFQMSLSPSVVKTSVKQYTFTARISWGRYTP